MTRCTRRRWAVATAVGAGVVAGYRWKVAPWQRNWGATADERHAVLAGDDRIAPPSARSTRAITIDASPESVWPWIVQLGADRGGFYSYDRLENLFGLDIHSADHIQAEWQDLEVGDLVAADRKRSGGWAVVELHPNEALVLQMADPTSARPLRRDQPPRLEYLWTFALCPTDDGRTRLVVRETVAFGSTAMRVLFAPVGLVSFVMTRRMLQGIGARAERSATTDR